MRFFVVTTLCVLMGFGSRIVNAETNDIRHLHERLVAIGQRRSGSVENMRNVEQAALALLSKDSSEIERSEVYASIAVMFANNGMRQPSKVAEYCEKALRGKTELLKACQLYVYWGEALQRLTHNGSDPKVSTKDALLPYLKGLKLVAERQVVREKRDVPPLGKYRYDGLKSEPGYQIMFNNLRHGRHGHVADGRFKAKLVEGDEYLLKLSRYVHLNPLVTGEIKEMPMKKRITHLRCYKWSSFREYVGLDRKMRLVDHEPLLAEFMGKRADRQKRYKRYVEMGLAKTDEEFMDALKESPRSIGSEDFRAWVDEVYQKLVKDGRRREDAAFRRTTEPMEIGKVMAVAAEVLGVDTAEFGIRRRNSQMRGVAAHLLCRYAGLTQREVAEVLGIGSGAAVSQQMKKLGELLPKDRRLRCRMKQAEERLKEERCAKGGRRI